MTLKYINRKPEKGSGELNLKVTLKYQKLASFQTSRVSPAKQPFSSRFLKSQFPSHPSKPILMLMMIAIIQAINKCGDESTVIDMRGWRG